MEKNLLLTNADYLAYMQQVQAIIQKLPQNDQYEIKNEISSHIYESLLHHPELTVAAAVQSLGDPLTYLPDWIMTRRLELATRAFHPIQIVGQLVVGIVKNTGHAIKYTLFALLYLFTFAFGSLIVFKLVAPRHTGLLLFPNGIAFGYSSDISNAHEIMGSWFIPVCLFITIILYMIITLLLKMSLFRVKSQYL